MMVDPGVARQKVVDGLEREGPTRSLGEMLWLRQGVTLTLTGGE
jgi:hypothetical protein